MLIRVRHQLHALTKIQNNNWIRFKSQLMTYYYSSKNELQCTLTEEKDANSRLHGNARQYTNVR